MKRKSFIGGSFTGANAIYRQYIAKIKKSDMSVDTALHIVQAVLSDVLHLTGRISLRGRRFYKYRRADQKQDSKTSRYIGTGGCNFNPNAGGSVNAIEYKEGYVYAAGAFTTIGE